MSHQTTSPGRLRFATSARGQPLANRSKSTATDLFAALGRICGPGPDWATIRGSALPWPTICGSGTVSELGERLVDRGPRRNDPTCYQDRHDQIVCHLQPRMVSTPHSIFGDKPGCYSASRFATRTKFCERKYGRYM